MLSLKYKQFWIMSWTLLFVKDKWYKIKSQERWVRCCGKSLMKRALGLDSVKEGFCSAHLHHGVGWLLLNHPLFIVLHILFDANPNKASRYFTGSLEHWPSGIHILCLALALVMHVYTYTQNETHYSLAVISQFHSYLTPYISRFTSVW